MKSKLNKKVVIMGGGVAGMSAAQELAERGFDVTVYEMKEIPGGKARWLRRSVRRPKGKKFEYKQLQQLLLSVQSKINAGTKKYSPGYH